MLDNKVGYKNPPMKSRFQKGKSGNPSGRPRGQNSPAALMDKFCRQLIPIIENGKKRMVTLEDAITMRLLTKAAAGDDKSMATFYKFLPQILAMREINNPHPSTVVLKNYVAVLNAQDREEMAAAVQNYNDLVKAGEDPHKTRGQAPVSFWAANPERAAKLKETNAWENNPNQRTQSSAPYSQSTPVQAEPAKTSPAFSSAAPAQAAPPSEPKSNESSDMKLTLDEYNAYFKQLVDERVNAVVAKMQANGTLSFATPHAINMAILSIPPAQLQPVQIPGRLIGVAELTSQVESQIKDRVMEHIQKMRFGS